MIEQFLLVAFGCAVGFIAGRYFGRWLINKVWK